ncbi:MAG TPA: Fe-S cluster assembly protein SufD [Steroidobacteraceae bacterium]|nr:Fe-S cluster assembly protein SufD [Steroidobacteraceae bacterium]
MSPLTPALAQRLAAEHASASGSLAAPAAAAAHSALEALLAAGLPTTRDENWKYANLRPLEKARYLPAAGAGGPSAAVTAALMPPTVPEFARYVFVDGVLAPGLSAPLAGTTAALGLHAGTAGALVAGSADERFALLNAAFAPQALSIGVPAAATVRLELLFIAAADAQHGASYPRVQVEVGPGAQLALIERHLSGAELPGFVNGAVTLAIGAGSRCTHYRLQHLNARSVYFDTLAARLAARATYRLYGTATGGQSARSTMTVRLEGEHADLQLAMAALGDRQQVQDAYAVVEHCAPNARTEQIFRGIAAGRARVAFNGKIVVAPGANGTDSRQSLRGLLAGPEAEIDVRPQLEIYTDDVRCSHGATAGKLDDDMLFYLLSRGLTRETAQHLLKWAFLGDVVAKIELPGLRRQIEERLVGQLQDDTLRELL